MGVQFKLVGLLEHVDAMAAVELKADLKICIKFMMYRLDMLPANLYGIIL